MSDKPTRALSIRQPHAEAIMRGVKKTEYRSAPTRIRGRILIYASLGRYSAEEEAEMTEDYGIDDVDCDDLPRGVVIGTVDLYDCDARRYAADTGLSVIECSYCKSGSGF